MENNATPGKLDVTIKDSLSNYDAKYDSGDWARMERLLDATPKSMAPKGSKTIALILGAVVLVGGFLIYKGINSSKKSEETTVAPVELPIEKTAEPITKTTPPAAKTKDSEPTSTSAPIVIPPSEVKSKVPEPKTIVSAVEPKLKPVAEKRKKEKKQNTSTLDIDFPKNLKVTVMGNEPIFGDMIDSSKGIVRETKEKESTKKEAVIKGSNNIGLSGLLNLNADSTLKQKELMKNDTLQK
jgi:outer membrane biosynthesis protein TonB